MLEIESASNKAFKSARFQIRPVYVFVVISCCVIGLIFWWNSLTSGSCLISARKLSISLYKPYGLTETSHLENKRRLKVGGDKLNFLVEEKLKTEGFEKSWLLGGKSPERIVGRYRGSPRIELRLQTQYSSNEAGLFFEIAADYTCQLPRSTLRYQEEMSQLIKKFEIELQSWLDGCELELRKDLPEFQ